MERCSLQCGGGSLEARVLVTPAPARLELTRAGEIPPADPSIPCARAQAGNLLGAEAPSRGRTDVEICGTLGRCAALHVRRAAADTLVSGAPVVTSAQAKPEACRSPASRCTDGAFGRRAQALEANLAQAEAEYAKNRRAKTHIWLGGGRRYLWRYRDAIDTFAKGIALHPNSYKLYRHAAPATSPSASSTARYPTSKGGGAHQERARQVEADGAPNKYGKPADVALEHLVSPRARLLPERRLHQRAARLPGCMKFRRRDRRVRRSTGLHTYRRPGARRRRQLLDQVTEKMRFSRTSRTTSAAHVQGLRQAGTAARHHHADDLTIATQGYGFGTSISSKETRRRRRRFTRRGGGAQRGRHSATSRPKSTSRHSGAAPHKPVN